MRRYYFDLLANTVAPSSNRGMECRYMQPSRKKLSARSPLWSGMQSARECSTNQDADLGSRWRGPVMQVSFTIATALSRVLQTCTPPTLASCSFAISQSAPDV